jgi:cell wall-associated NlpC family hydrolase
MAEPETRAAIVVEAMTWAKTPWHHEARVKGAGVDCAQFLIGVYAAVGLIDPIAIEHYPADWHLHRDERRFLDSLLQYADPVEDGRPGDIAMFEYGRHAAHGSIVVEWPLIIHAWRDEGMVVLSDASNGQLQERFAGFYRLKCLA